MSGPQRVKVIGDLFHGVVPDGAVYIGRGTPGLRGSRYANPFRLGKPITDPVFRHATVGGVPLYRGGFVEDRQHAVDLYAFWVMAKVPFTQEQVVADLGGRDLACWCPTGLACHGDPLLVMANGGEV
ncbi:DUF4326 domain-containing protein [Micromonospora tulbaghiae]|uniref:DUF4326 domain-containing protein n=1 Tax=Micromonospora tulbaghiae TaxID=479978 RepID=UPI0033AE66C9